MENRRLLLHLTKRDVVLIETGRRTSLKRGRIQEDTQRARGQGSGRVRCVLGDADACVGEVLTVP